MINSSKYRASHLYSAALLLGLRRLCGGGSGPFRVLGGVANDPCGLGTLAVVAAPRVEPTLVQPLLFPRAVNVVHPVFVCEHTPYVFSEVPTVDQLFSRYKIVLFQF